MRELSENVNNDLVMYILLYTVFFAFEIDLIMSFTSTHTTCYVNKYNVLYLNKDPLNKFQIFEFPD